MQIDDATHIYLARARAALDDLTPTLTNQPLQKRLERAADAISDLLQTVAETARREEISRSLISLHERFVTAADPSPLIEFPAALRRVADAWEPF